MFLITGKRIIKTGSINFWRNRWLSLASVFMMSITLLTISMFIILSLVIHSTTGAVKDKMDMKITFKDEVTEVDIMALKTDLGNRDDVKSVTYIDKNQAINRWNQLKIKETVKKLVSNDNNPLPRSLEVKVKDPSSLDVIEESLKKPTYATLIESTSYQKNKETIETLLNITKVVKQLGWGLSIIFFLISMIVILNTVRMAIFARQQEIEIMKLVGATDIYVNLPFVVEGMLYGIGGGFISIIIMIFGAYYISDFIDKNLQLSVKVGDYFFSHLGLIVLGQIMLAIILGAICSTVGVRKYLKLY